MKKILLGIIILFLMIMAAQKGNESLMAISTPSKKDLVIVQSSLPGNLDPNKNISFDHALPITAIYEGLVKFNYETLAIEPCLAEKWEVSDNARRWTFHLKPNLYFSDGTECDAEAVKASLSRSMVLKDSQPYCSLIFNPVSSIETEGKYSVSFILKYPYAPFIKNLALPFGAPIVSPNALSNNGDNFWKYPSGTGPYVLEKFSGNKIVLRENAYYREKPLPFKRIIIKSEPDPGKRNEQLIKGQADIIMQPDQLYIGKLNEQGMKIISTPGIDVSYLGFYTDKPPFDNKYIRIAVANLLDRHKIVNNLMQGEGVPADGLLPQPIAVKKRSSYQETVSSDLVRRILNREGYPDGIDVTLITYQEKRRYSPTGGNALAQEIKRQLAPAGIKVTIQSRPWKEHQAAMKNKTGNFFLYGWTGDNGDADNFMYTLLDSSQIEHGINATSFRNSKLDAYLDNGRKIVDDKSRAHIYLQAEDLVLSEMPVTAINHSLIKAAYRPDITGVKLSGFGLIDLLAVMKI